MKTDELLFWAAYAIPFILILVSASADKLIGKTPWHWKHFYCGVDLMIAVLCAALAGPGRAESLTTARDQLIIGIAVVSAGIAVGVTLLILHERHKQIALTGCVASTASGMSLTDDKDKRVYTLSGNPAGVKPGQRMTFAGKRKTVNGTLIFEARSVTKDFGVCQP